MGTNPYELRLQLFQEAKNICWEEYNRDVNEFERQRDKQNELKEKYYEDKSKYESLKEDCKLGSMEYPSYPDLPELPEYPEYPSMDEIKNRATFIRNFCDDKGDVPAPRNWKEELKGEERSNYLSNTYKDSNINTHLIALKKGTGISS